MKQLVTRESLTGWREPNEKDLKAIKIYDDNLKIEEISYILRCVAVMVMVCGICIFGREFFEKLTIRSFVVTIFGIGISTLIVLNSISRSYEVNTIRKFIKNQDYRVENCYINSIEHQIDVDTNKVIRQAYIHNDLCEYCTEPISVTVEIESLTKSGKDVDFILMNIEDTRYIVIELAD